MNPGEVTTVIMKFDLPAVPFTSSFQPTNRRERVCMALSHSGARRTRYDAAISGFVNTNRRTLVLNYALSEQKRSVFCSGVSTIFPAFTDALVVQAAVGQIECRH